MLILVLGKGKTGSLVAQVARERGHGVRVLDFNENRDASALTAPRWLAWTWSSTSPTPTPPSRTCAPCWPWARASCRNHRLVRASERDEGARHPARRRTAVWNQLLHRRAETLPPHR